MAQSHSEYRWVFRCLWNAAKESASLVVCGRGVGHSRVWNDYDSPLCTTLWSNTMSTAYQDG